MNFEPKASVVEKAGKACGFAFSFLIFSAVVYAIFFYSSKEDLSYFSFLMSAVLVFTVLSAGYILHKFLS